MITNRKITNIIIAGGGMPPTDQESILSKSVLESYEESLPGVLIYSRLNAEVTTDRGGGGSIIINYFYFLIL